MTQLARVCRQSTHQKLNKPHFNVNPASTPAKQHLLGLTFATENFCAAPLRATAWEPVRSPQQRELKTPSRGRSAIELSCTPTENRHNSEAATPQHTYSFHTWLARLAHTYVFRGRTTASGLNAGAGHTVSILGFCKVLRP